MTAKQQGSVFTVTTLLTLVPKSLLLQLHSCTTHFLALFEYQQFLQLEENIYIIVIYNYFNVIAVIYSVTRLTGVSQAMLRTEQPLSVGLPQFLDWVDTVVAEVSDATCTSHFLREKLQKALVARRGGD